MGIESNAAYEDLELDVRDSLANPAKFAEQVYTKAEELKAILKSDHSITGLTSTINATSTPLDPKFNETFVELYKQSDEIPLEMLPSLIDAAKQFVRDLETALRDRVVYAVADREGNVANKRVAHAQYISLREKFNLWVNFVNPVLGTEFKPLPALPGNYGSGGSALKHYVWNFYETGDAYRNHRAVIRRINREAGYNVISPDTFLSDFLADWTDKLDTYGVELKEIV